LATFFTAAHEASREGIASASLSSAQPGTSEYSTSLSVNPSLVAAGAAGVAGGQLCSGHVGGDVIRYARSPFARLMVVPLTIMPGPAW